MMTSAMNNPCLALNSFNLSSSSMAALSLMGKTANGWVDGRTRMGNTGCSEAAMSCPLPKAFRYKLQSFD
jgi:hypothetical protein